MKWLTTVLCLLAFHATAQEIPNIKVQDPKVLVLPILVQCSSDKPDDMFKKEYGELGFLDGEATVFVTPDTVISGDFRMFLNPEDTRSFSIVLEVKDMSCLVMSGQGIAPMTQGDGI